MIGEDVARIGAILAKARIDLSNEKAAQTAIAETLAEGGMRLEREHRLSARDRPDFFLPESGLAVEVKLRAGRMDVYRQLRRYASHEAVRGLLLVSNTAMALPVEIEGKPAFSISLGRAWL
jgi:hypothetical protein